VNYDIKPKQEHKDRKNNEAEHCNNWKKISFIKFFAETCEVFHLLKIVWFINLFLEVV
jgi:hypothetical protein